MSDSSHTFQPGLGRATAPDRDPGAPRPKAVIVGVQLPGVDDDEHTSSLDELERLATTLGLQVVARVTQKRSALAASAVVGEGKLVSLAELTGGSGVVPTYAPEKKQKKHLHDQAEDDDAEDDDDRVHAEAEPGAASGLATVVLVDHDITPSQARNLEKATGAEVLDRTAVILAIFHRHARTREARLQVEIARLNYLAPRLRESGGGKDRQRGGVGNKGAGESAMELDRRKIRDRIAELREELAEIEKESGTRRRRRADASTVALVGYTNAGKSSLMRALTGSEVYVADELFATLDTTVRALSPETKPRILASDTVGFIKKLPHDLVASFRSTLEEAREAQLLLHVVDAADHAFPQQIEVTLSVLAEIGVGDEHRLLVLNKADQIDEARQAELRAAHPDAVLMSARRPEDVRALRERIIAFFEARMIHAELCVPYGKQSLLGEVHTHCKVAKETWDERGATLEVLADPDVLARLRAQLASLAVRRLSRHRSGAGSPRRASNAAGVSTAKPRSSG